MTTFNQVKDLILAQGIVSRVAILLETDLVLDLNYKPVDRAELFRMIQREFKINLDPEEFTSLTRIEQITHYIQESRQITKPC
ncbi:acyl carrier protein [Adhaeribacter radiodurans]|uniref:Acyl carrier protein n=1 Tax=Adhaeribacter radiodurans TaxID=2745197 RepID=A0A7L7L254_9BACT|nr:acyl carrier protein [Adhaeribacter radiodurans]QMU26871.1 acyl carrier protein [Adhaeribacter radiodurans]